VRGAIPLDDARGEHPSSAAILEGIPRMGVLSRSPSLLIDCERRVQMSAVGSS